LGLSLSQIPLEEKEKTNFSLAKPHTWVLVAFGGFCWVAL
jgi:hypothetical protein